MKTNPKTRRTPSRSGAWDTSCSRASIGTIFGRAGANTLCRTVRTLKKLKSSVLVEALTPDFRGDMDAVAHLARSGLDVFAHNVETVERLQKRGEIRAARYEQSLSVLRHAKESKEGLVTKTSIMLGLGEEDDEIAECMRACKEAGVDIFTLGQYLQPTPQHLP